VATRNAIAAIGQAILGLLASACPRAEFAGAQFELYQGHNFQSPMDEGVCLYLHRITPANNIRNLPPRLAPNGKRYRPSLPIDLHYLLIAWARDAVKQQRLLGWAMRELENTPILHASVLNQHGPEPDTFDTTESVDLIQDSIPIQDMGAIWEVARHHMQPSVVYTARMVRIDSDVEITDAGPVQTRVLAAGKAVER
jgi:Pvc16 N-terminal domain